MSLASATVFSVYALFIYIWTAHGFNIMYNQPADSAVGYSEVILMAARDKRVFDGRIHVCVEVTELLVPNNL